MRPAIALIPQPCHGGAAVAIGGDQAIAAMAETTRDKDRLFVNALARGLSVLRCFTPDTPELGASEIARLTGFPQPTVWRLCHTLLELGYLVALPGRQTMRPGIPLLGLGQSVLATQSVAQLALFEMQAIARRHEGAVSLGARDGADMVYLQRCQGSAIILAHLGVGSRVPVATSATGWAYIAGLSLDARNRVFADLARDRPDDWKAAEPKLRLALEAFEHSGYIVNIGSLHPRINSVAVPVSNPESTIVYALSSGGISDSFKPELLPAIAVELKALAALLMPALAFQPH